MRTRYFVGGLVAAALLSTTALAQTAAPGRAPAATTAPAAATDTTLQGKQWRASKVIGINIYNEQNEKLGDINEIILDPAGKVMGYIVGVGGFLGMGEHDIFVEPGKIRFVNEPIRTSSTTTTTTTTTNTTNPPPASAPTVTRNVSATTSNDRWYPDHGIMSATKDQLKTMPQFKY